MYIIYAIAIYMNEIICTPLLTDLWSFWLANIVGVFQLAHWLQYIVPAVQQVLKWVSGHGSFLPWCPWASLVNPLPWTGPTEFPVLADVSFACVEGKIKSLVSVMISFSAEARVKFVLDATCSLTLWGYLIFSFFSFPGVQHYLAAHQRCSLPHCCPDCLNIFSLVANSKYYLYWLAS